MAKTKSRLSNNSNEQIILGYTPHDGQALIHNAINELNYKYYIIANGRQWGKTLMCINQILFWALNEPNSNIYYVSPTFKLAREVFQKMLNVCTDAGVLAEINKTNLSLIFVSGSKLSFHSGERPSTLRGATLSHLVLDESAYCKPELWEEVLKPATLVKGKKVVFISTPAGKNWFYDLYMKGKTGQKNYISFTSPSTQNPLIPKDEIEEASKNDLVYRQEYLAEFIQDKLSVFQNYDECIYKEDITTNSFSSNNQYFIGIDLARKDDFTVAFVLDQNKRVVDLFRMNYTNWNFILDRLVDLYQKWKPTYGYCEINFNDRIFDELQERGCTNLRPFVTSAQNKPVIIQSMIMDFQNKAIQIPDLDFLKDELDNFTYRFNKNTGKIHYAGREGLHDDCVMALGFALQAIKDKAPGTSGLYWEVI